MIRQFRHMVLLLALTGLFCSCTQVEDARHVVAEADSLRAVGMAYDDSISIAEAAATLSHVRAIYPNDYAHANYYYGRLLRNRDDQPAAMLAFLNVIHSRTEDYVIKGRSYSNIANMCRLAANHELAYDIYKCSAEEFLKAKDTTAYYYAINNYAYECAEMRNKKLAFNTLKIIEEQCTDPNVIARVLETKAEACLKSKDYDSVLFFINQTYPPFSQETSNLLLRAQAFSHLEEKDSALFYANQVINGGSSWFEKNNAYYILANFNDSSSKNDVLQIAADRSDIQKLIEIRQGRLSQATQLLQQDLNRKPDLKWLVAVIITLVIIGATLTLYIKRKRRQHQLFSQRVAKAQEEHRNLAKQNTQLEQVLTQHQKKALTEIEVFCAAIQNRSELNEKLCWKDFDKMCSIVNQRMFGLVDKLNTNIVLNEKEMRLCVLVAIGNFSNNEMADLICYDPHSLRSIKSKIAGQLGISGKNMHNHLLKLAIGGCFYPPPCAIVDKQK